MQPSGANPVFRDAVPPLLDTWLRALLIIVLALPFLGQGIPYPGGVSFFVPVAVLLLPASVLLTIARRGRSGLIIGDPVFMIICVVVLLGYAYGILLSADYPGLSLMRDAITGVVAMMVTFTLANGAWSKPDRESLVRALAWTLLAIGVFVGVIGALKFWLFVTRGQMLGFVVAASSGPYPWGTSLVSDYNFYALTILTAILSAMFLAAGRGRAVQVVLGLTVAVLLVIGFLAGSRRFWLAAPLFIALQAAWMISAKGFRRNLPLLATFVTLLIAVPLVLFAIFEDTLTHLMTAGWNLQYRLSTFLDSGSGFGLGTRLELWSSAADRLGGAAPWIGSGFDYMRWFSCEFGDCSGAGYPHMPVLSAFLYGGIISAIFVVAFYLYTTLAGFRLLAAGPVLGWLVFPMMAALVFAAISANGPLSIRTHVLLGALCVGLLFAERAGAPAFALQDR